MTSNWTYAPCSARLREDIDVRPLVDVTGDEAVGVDPFGFQDLKLLDGGKATGDLLPPCPRCVGRDRGAGPFVGDSDGL